MPMERAAGIAIICQNKILLCHPTNSAWENSYSIPKGLLEDGEDDISAAIRETFEETGLNLSKLRGRLESEGRHLIEYRRKNGVYKTVVFYILRINSTSEIGMDGGCVVPKEQLQLAEVDWAGFVSKDEATKKIFWKLTDVLKHLE